jgi:hypothetical protein
MKAVSVRPGPSTCHADTRCPCGTSLASRVPAKPALARSSRKRRILPGIMSEFDALAYFTPRDCVHLRQTLEKHREPARKGKIMTLDALEGEEHEA